jgi:hypothetical protein
MFRWWFAALVLGAILSQFAPAAFADGCEGGDSTAGHSAIAFCCDKGDRDRGHSRGGRSVIISGIHAR